MFSLILVISLMAASIWQHFSDKFIDRLLQSPIIMKLMCFFFIIHDEDFAGSESLINGQLTFNTLRPRQNGCHFADNIFKCIFLNENVFISIKCPTNNIPALVQIMAWRRPGDKPLSEPMMVWLPTHICVTRPQWVNDVSITWDRPMYSSKSDWFNPWRDSVGFCQPFGIMPSLTGRCGNNSKKIIFKLMVQNSRLSNCCEIAHMWM